MQNRRWCYPKSTCCVQAVHPLSVLFVKGRSQSFPSDYSNKACTGTPGTEPPAVLRLLRSTGCPRDIFHYGLIEAGWTKHPNRNTAKHRVLPCNRFDNALCYHNEIITYNNPCAVLMSCTLGICTREPGAGCCRCGPGQVWAHAAPLPPHALGQHATLNITPLHDLVLLYAFSFGCEPTSPTYSGMSDVLVAVGPEMSPLYVFCMLRCAVAGGASLA